MSDFPMLPSDLTITTEEEADAVRAILAVVEQQADGLPQGGVVAVGLARNAVVMHTALAAWEAR